MHSAANCGKITGMAHTLSPSERRAQVILNTLTRVRGLTDQALAGPDRTRAFAQTKRTGTRAITLEDIAWLSKTLKVDPTLFVVDVEDWDEYGSMGLPPAELAYLRAELEDEVSAIRSWNCPMRQGIRMPAYCHLNAA